MYFFLFKQKTAYEMRISDWSSDVCSSDLGAHQGNHSRKHQYVDRIAAHGAQGIDFFPHFHGAELGRVGAAGPAGDHDRHDQYADFAQDEDADQDLKSVVEGKSV